MGHPELSQYLARINVSCSRTQRSEAGDACTRSLSISSQARYRIFKKGAAKNKVSSKTVVFSRVLWYIPQYTTTVLNFADVPVTLSTLMDI